MCGVDGRVFTTGVSLLAHSSFSLKLHQLNSLECSHGKLMRIICETAFHNYLVLVLGSSLLGHA